MAFIVTRYNKYRNRAGEAGRLLQLIEHLRFARPLPMTLSSDGAGGFGIFPLNAHVPQTIGRRQSLFP